MNKLTKAILSVSAAVVALAGVVVLVLHFWEDIQALLPCKKPILEDDFVEEL